ncbi:MAG TPA: hypothetical protein VN328_00915 [Thermodesulfovibrionales bacterium]|nr:hypothetical protein [Thermodesulfovibrionales bacterium]
MRSDFMGIGRNPVRTVTVVVVIAFLMPFVVFADIPAQLEVYAQWEQVKKTVEQHFSASEAAALQKKLQKAIDIYSSRPLHTAYRDRTEFINLGDSGSVLGGLVEIVGPRLSKAESTKVKTFLETLNNGKMFQGLSISRNYSGCLLVTFELVVSDRGEYEVKAFHAPFGLPGCELSQPRPDFKGITFTMSTGVAAPPEGSRMDKNISKKEQHSVISFFRRKALWKARADGTGAKKVITTDTETPSAISPDGKWIIYHAGSDPLTGFGRLYRVPSAGGKSEALKMEGFTGGQYPSFSPDGKSIVFVGMSDVKAGKIKGYDAVYATMSVAVLDLITGNTQIIVGRKNVLLDAGYVYSNPSFSPDGRLIAYQHSGSDVSGGFSVIDMSGMTVFRFPKSGSDPTPFWRPQFSTDGKQVLCYSPATSEDRIDTIFMIDMKTGSKLRITEGSNPAFVDNGSAIVFERWVNKWSPDGNAKSDLWYLELREGAQPRKILDNASQPSYNIHGSK